MSPILHLLPAGFNTGYLFGAVSDARICRAGSRRSRFPARAVCRAVSDGDALFRAKEGGLFRATFLTTVDSSFIIKSVRTVRSAEPDRQPVREGKYTIMIKSMTGFGRCEIAKGERKITVEMKSVNHRYLDITIKMPKKLNFFEAAIRNELKNYIQRGKVDVFITYEDMSEANVCVTYNREAASAYMKYLAQMAEDFGLDNDVRVSTLSRYPEVFGMEEQTVDEEELWQFLSEAIRGAAEKFVDTRIREGENLRDDLVEKLDGMLAHVDYITERSPQIVTEYRQKLEEKVKELLGDVQVDEARLLTEVTIFADKVCVDEELVRLRSHIETTRENLLQGGSIGRKLDFIAQEMNREANTILSKANDLEISNRAIELKTEIEKVREQIQNIE